MRLTALCVCGTLLAFSSLSRAAAGRDAPPEDGEPGPCEATLRPGGACGPGQRGGSCPYLFSLPPLTLHLPLQLRELEKITQDLERLKESVDQLREMCADCKVSQTYGRECGRQKEGERERLGTGGGAGEDGREWMNERLDEKDLRKECGNAGGHAVEEKDLKGEADRKSNTKVVKENEEEEETWTVAEKDAITKTGSEREKGPSVQRKVPASGANERIDDAMREKSNQNSDTNSNKTDAGEENSNRHQEDKLMTTVEKKRKTEESGTHEWRDETNSNEKKTQPEFSDRKKLFENHGEYTNKEPRLRGEEMEEGIKVHRNNEKPKQTVTTGWAEKESAIKEGQLDEEGRERGTEIKTESEQRDGDGESSTGRATQRADSSPISPTARSNKATFFSSFVPLPSLVSPTLSSIADVPRDTIGVYGPTQSTSLKAAGFSEPRSPGGELTTVGGRAEQITSITARSDSASKVRPGSQGHFSSTTTTPKITTPHLNLYVTAFSEAADSSRSTPKTNVSSKTKTGVKPLPGKGPKPGERRNHGDSPEAEQTLKNAKNVLSVPDRAPKAESNKTSILEPPSPYGAVGPGAKPIPRPKLAEQPEPNQKTKTYSDPAQVGWATLDPVQNSQTNVPPTSGLVKRIAGTTRSPEDAGLGAGVRKGVAPAPKTSNSPEAAFEDSTLSPDSGMASDLRPQTTARPSAIPTTARPNRIHLPTVISGTSPASTRPGLRPHSPSSTHAETLHNMKDKTPSATAVPSPGPQTASKLLPDFRPLTPATSSPEPPAAEPSTPGARELRVKINQVPAFPDNRGGPEEQPGGPLPGPDKANGKLPTIVKNSGDFNLHHAICGVRRDCSDHLRRGETKSGVYLVTPDLRSRSFPVVCDMERDGGGWTLLQRRQDGSVSFDRTWAEYQSGFGNLDGGEFWLGNNKIHWLTRDRDMVLRVELEDFNGVAEHAQYDQFRVAGERLRYRLTVGGYSGTAGDALRFSKTYDHNNRAFTTPDRDHDRYPSGNCGAYYSSGWWFDACMAANLNGKYYVGTYKGVRNGIFWGTWHNISTEYYPTNERQSFKTVRMMIRPKGFAP
ncbi:unnamed protein product [Menidia menidia]|uniref:(Atlantic silverside) hypothetical protein n=1 Tax=Menidia menidia TaxID=238744 RepID=A0A8S4BJ05_9TELE|nr:unnamed protein product [Menidia menidia]